MIDIMILNQKFVRSARAFANATLTLFISGSLALGAAATADAQLTNGLLGFWRMDGNGDDSSGNHRPLSLFGGAGFDSGLNCRALNLPNDLNQYAARGVDDPELDFGGGDFTLSLWTYYYSLQNEQVLIEKFEGSTGPGWTLTKLANQNIRFATAGAGSTYDTPLTLSINRWHHLLLRREGNRLDLFHNGQVAGTFTINGVITDTSMPLLIGKRNHLDGRGFPMNGRMDEVGIWSRSLSNEEVALVYHNGRGEDCRSLGDVNCDGCVDDTDLLLLLFAFGQTGSGLEADINCDEVVDDADLLAVLFVFGDGC